MELFIMRKTLGVSGLLFPFSTVFIMDVSMWKHKDLGHTRERNKPTGERGRKGRGVCEHTS